MPPGKFWLDLRDKPYLFEGGVEWLFPRKEVFYSVHCWSPTLMTANSLRLAWVLD